MTIQRNKLGSAKGQELNFGEVVVDSVPASSPTTEVSLQGCLRFFPVSSKNIAIPVYPPLFTLFVQVYLLQGAAKKGGPSMPNLCPSDFPWAYNEVGGELNVNCQLIN